MNPTRKLLIGGALIACLCGAVATSAAPSANGLANSANSGANQAPNANSLTNNGQGNQKDTTPGNNGLAKGHDKKLVEMAEAFDVCFSAGEAGVVSGYNDAARLLMEGDKDFTDLDSAMAIINKAIQLNSPEAKYLKGVLLIGEEVDVTAGLNYVMDAARADYPDAQLLLARLYKEGKHLPKDEQLAAEWAKYAADLGLPSASVDIALGTLDATAKTGENESTALKRLLDAANKNDRRAASKVSAMFLGSAQPTADDYEAARKYAQIAYENGSLEGAFLMAKACFQEDPDAALDWLEKGSSQNEWQCLHAHRLITRENMPVSDAIDETSKITRKEAMNYILRIPEVHTSKLSPPTVLSFVYHKIPAALQGVDLLVRVPLRFTVNTKGIPTDIEVVAPSEYEALNAAAVEAIAQWRFRPATKNGHPASCKVNITVKFSSAR